MKFKVQITDDEGKTATIQKNVTLGFVVLAKDKDLIESTLIREAAVAAATCMKSLIKDWKDLPAKLQAEEDAKKAKEAENVIDAPKQKPAEIIDLKSGEVIDSLPTNEEIKNTLDHVNKEEHPFAPHDNQ